MEGVLQFLQQNGVAIAVSVVPVAVGVAIGVTKKVAVAKILKESGDVMTSLGTMIENTTPETVKQVFTEAEDFRSALKMLTGANLAAK